jgi:CarD family transcriptional regulator
MVPKDNTGTIGVRPTISATDCTRVLKFLGENFEETEGDWKVRIKDFSCRMQTGDIFDAADVLKKLNHLATQKTLSFREQRLFERARFLVISELSAVCSERECETEKKVDSQLEKSLKKHTLAVAASGFH